MLKLFVDKNGEVRGWRIVGVFAFVYAMFAVQMFVRGGTSPQMQTAVIVLGCFVAAGAVVTWMVDCLQRRRDRQIGAGRVSRIPDWFFARGDRKSNAMLLGACGVVLVPVTVSLIVPPLLREWESLAWKAVDGTSLGVEVQRGYNAYEVTVEMAFVIGNEQHVLKLPADGMTSIRQSSQVRQLQTTFASGTQHVLYVDPIDPGRASLRRGPSPGAIIGSITVPVLAVGLFVLSVRTVIAGLGRTMRSGADESGIEEASRAA